MMHLFLGFYLGDVQLALKQISKFNFTYFFSELSRLLLTNNGGSFDDDDGEEEDDPDIINDPLYRINMRQYLTELISEFAKQPYFSSHFAPHLNVMEKKALTSIGIQC